MIQWMCPESCASLLLFVYLLFHPGKKFFGGGEWWKAKFQIFLPFAFVVYFVEEIMKMRSLTASICHEMFSSFYGRGLYAEV